MRTIFLPVTFVTTQSTLGSRHKALFQRVTLAFEGALATLGLFPCHLCSTLSTSVSFDLTLVGHAIGRVFAVLSFATECVISSSHSQCR